MKRKSAADANSGPSRRRQASGRILRAAPRPPPPPRQPHENGVLTFIEVVDFKNHEHMRVGLGPASRFLGESSRGKSPARGDHRRARRQPEQAHAAGGRRPGKGLIATAPTARAELGLANGGGDAFAPGECGPTVTVRVELERQAGDRTGFGTTWTGGRAETAWRCSATTSTCRSRTRASCSPSRCTPPSAAPRAPRAHAPSRSAPASRRSAGTVARAVGGGGAARPAQGDRQAEGGGAGTASRRAAAAASAPRWGRSAQRVAARPPHQGAPRRAAACAARAEPAPPSPASAAAAASAAAEREAARTEVQGRNAAAEARPKEWRRRRRRRATRAPEEAQREQKSAPASATTPSACGRGRGGGGRGAQGVRGARGSADAVASGGSTSARRCAAR